MSSISLNKGDDGRYKIHQSDIGQFQRCKRKFAWGSRHGRELQTKEPQSALWMGTGIHVALEYYYRDGENPNEVWEAWVDFESEYIDDNSSVYDVDWDEIDEQRELGHDMLEYYKTVDPDEKITHKNDEFDIVSVEEKFEIPLETPNGNKSQCDLAGRVDGVVKDDLGRLWLLEHKTYTNNDLSHLEMDQQASYYFWAMSKKYGEQFEGVLYNVLLKDTPQKPDVNKSGSVSKRKKKALTRELYEQVIEDQDEDKSDYQDTLEWIDENSYEFVKRKRVRRNDAQLEVIGHQLYTLYREMQGSEIYPEPMKRWGDMCNDCSFKTPCQLANEGRNPNPTLNQQFEKRPAHRKEEVFADWFESDKSIDEFIN